MEKSDYQSRHFKRELNIANDFGASAAVGKYHVDVNMDILEEHVSHDGDLSKLSEYADTCLMGVMPILRSVAAAPDVARELDFWRPHDYQKTDHFCVFQPILGEVSTERDVIPVSLSVDQYNGEILKDCFRELGVNQKTVLSSYKKWATQRTEGDTDVSEGEEEEEEDDESESDSETTSDEESDDE